ncbi:MAG: winged helix-turn-helix transcriptional regulator, partial [Lachnospiraceae bacterium]|nr:winged helix-turn-helix transcriptional regulator [Lachnospiraceae bacterium]
DTDGDTDKNSNDTENDIEKIVSDTEYRLLELLMINPGQTIDSFAKNLQLSVITVKRCLKSLKDKGIIQRIGSDRKGYWRIERGI